MTEFNCKNLSTIVSEIKSLKPRFSNLYEVYEYNAASKIKDEIVKLLEAANEMLNPANIFLSEIRKDKFWDEIVRRHFRILLSATHPDSRKSFEHFEELTSRLPVPQTLKGSAEYQDFIEKLVSDKEIADHMESHRIYASKTAYAMLNSCFLNKYIKKDQKLIVKDLPEQLSDNFGCFLKKGHIFVGKCGQNLGVHLQGGNISAQETYGGAGDYMSDGTLKISHSKDNDIISLNTVHSDGYKMSGGTLYIEESDYEDGVAFEKNGGTLVTPSLTAGFSGNVKKGTILFSKASSVPVGIRNGEAYFFDQIMSKYLSADMNSRLFVEKDAKRQKDMHRFFKDQSLISVENLGVIEPFPESRMNGGVLVYRDVPKGEIGKGMKNGVVIIENDKISIEDAKSRISKDRPGGVILMRVWETLADKTKSRKSRLIDLEKPQIIDNR